MLVLIGISFVVVPQVPGDKFTFPSRYRLEWMFFWDQAIDFTLFGKKYQGSDKRTARKNCMVSVTSWNVDAQLKPKNLTTSVVFVLKHI